MRFYTASKLGSKRSYTPEGFLVCLDVPIARTGEMLYVAGEIPGLIPGKDGLIRVQRDPAEVFKPEAMASFVGKPTTNDHPPEFVTPANFRRYACGAAANVRQGIGDQSDLLLADLLWSDPDAIKAIEGGKDEISLGYDAEYEQIAPGLAVQHSIIGNHVALVDDGRCGERCSIGDRAPFKDEFREEDHPRSDDGKFGTAHVVHSAKYDDNKGAWQSKIHSVHASAEGAQKAHDEAVAAAYTKMRSDDLKTYGETDYPEAPTIEEAWGHLGNKDNQHVFGTTAFHLDKPHDGEVSVVHEIGRDEDGDGESLIHGVYTDHEDAKAVAAETAEEVWEEHGEARGDELSEDEAEEVMAAHNAEHPEEHHVDENMDFVNDDEMEAIADDWNDEHAAEHHVTFHPSQRFDLENKPRYPRDFRIGPGNENESDAEYFARSRKSGEREEQIRAEIAEVYPFAQERFEANASLTALREEMFPEEEVKAFPGLRASNAYFRNGEKGLDEMGRTGIVAATRHKIEA